MKKLIQFAMLVAIITSLMSCAASHHSLAPDKSSYVNTVTQDGIELSYKYDILREANNNKNAKKADKRNLKLVAVKLTNHTDSVLKINSNINFYTGNNEIVLLQPTAIKNNLKQNVPVYALYGLLSFTQLNVSAGNSTSSFPIGLLIGPPIALFNILRANSANNKLLKELNHYNIINKEIKSKETVHGIIGFKMDGYNPLSVKRRIN